jgi:hypothetical protein
VRIHDALGLEEGGVVDADVMIERIIDLRTAHPAPATSAGEADTTASVSGEARVDEIVTALYRRFKGWSKRGFGPDDVTWCEVKADVLALIAAAAPVSQAVEQPADDAEDAARLDFLDTNVHRFRMGWEIGAAPVGNLSVRSIIMGGKPIREAIDAAMSATKQEGGHVD